MGCNVHDIQNKVVVYDMRKKNLKQLSYFGMIQNYDKIWKWNIKSGKNYTLWKIHMYSTVINTKHVIYWVNYMYFE
jgi:hypothetical protein